MGSQHNEGTTTNDGRLFFINKLKQGVDGRFLADGSERRKGCFTERSVILSARELGELGDELAHFPLSDDLHRQDLKFFVSFV